LERVPHTLKSGIFSPCRREAGELYLTNAFVLIQQARLTECIRSTDAGVIFNFAGLTGKSPPAPCHMLSKLTKRKVIVMNARDRNFNDEFD